MHTSNYGDEAVEYVEYVGIREYGNTGIRNTGIRNTNTVLAPKVRQAI